MQQVLCIANLDSNILTIKPKYKRHGGPGLQLMNTIVWLEPGDRPYQQITRCILDYNGGALTNDRNGNINQVKRVGTAGDVLQESINSLHRHQRQQCIAKDEKF